MPFRLAVMSVLTKLFAFVAAERGVSETYRAFRRLLSGMAAILGLSVLIAMLSGAVLIGGFYALYETLLAYDWTRQDAGLMIAAIALCLIAVLIYYLVTCFNNVRHLPSRMISTQEPISDRLSKISQSFMDGLQNK